MANRISVTPDPIHSRTTAFPPAEIEDDITLVLLRPGNCVVLVALLDTNVWGSVLINLWGLDLVAG
jgi:hypothetical protein